jgi:branched-chain amino acid transport system permease protein
VGQLPGAGVTALIALLGAAAMIEMVYHLQLNAALGPSCSSWAHAERQGRRQLVRRAFVHAHGLGLFELTRRHFLRQWGEIQEFIEKEIKRREAL